MELNSITSILNTLEREVRVMARDLKADLELCKNSAPIEFIYQSREGWPEAINRAIAAEKRVKELDEENRQLKAKVDTIADDTAVNIANQIVKDTLKRLGVDPKDAS
jgi:hypothetical protein